MMKCPARAIWRLYRFFTGGSECFMGDWQPDPEAVANLTIREAIDIGVWPGSPNFGNKSAAEFLQWLHESGALDAKKPARPKPSGR